MDIARIKREREGWLRWKHIAPLRRLLEGLKPVEAHLEIGDVVKLQGAPPQEELEKVEAAAWAMRPWRKGPFDLFGLFIESEWRSFIKYNLLAPFLDLEGKEVADIGCNNGYYMFRFLQLRPKQVVGFDPSPLFRTQFDLINHYARTPIVYELLGVEHLPHYGQRFDTIFALGILYHRRDPITTLQWLRRGLKPGGELFLDTLFIEADGPLVLAPAPSYAKMSNVYFVPSIEALHNWAIRAGFKGFEVLATRVTDTFEQHKSPWILGESLEDFLDPVDPTRTIEGYPAPRRVYVRLKER
ncbi:MAG: tRNA 5-methoxyuridine(34)/uridine 5-oxyacetic acid(34) synthase CmoB [Nitratiruptor sp.]|nr:tRNA 5-methoxyuridine(34)/uridine 5-oxyacetic acid(34) synthase CmoB [Nitratiruptor sp.]NPA83263.1 tRNA 5-methoxyuridine(34)/uridine 5-oxyacetic acid(34) synthase CmoB [Campylobacterota bacterium]